jgi:hypothetical protein
LPDWKLVYSDKNTLVYWRARPVPASPPASSASR